jgi:hypothetical protein
VGGFWLLEGFVSTEIGGEVFSFQFSVFSVQFSVKAAISELIWDAEDFTLPLGGLEARLCELPGRGRCAREERIES